MGDESLGGAYASPPCFLHELSPEQGGLAGDDPIQARDVARWRTAERHRLLAQRAALSVAARQEAATRIADALDTLLGDIRGKVISAYWPIKAELDLRPWLVRCAARGAVTALPVVTEKAQPLGFRAWSQGAAMERGFWNIPVPAEGDWLVPDIAIAPLVGFDAAGFRLGYGGGYFDRTLKALGPACCPVGIGLASAQVSTIFPQWHDVPMSAIVTEQAVWQG